MRAARSYARRVQKRRLSKTGAVLSVVRYVWNGDHVVHELHEGANDNAALWLVASAGSGGPAGPASTGGNGNAVVLPFRREKTYAFAPESLQPLAHRVTAGQRDATGDGVRAANAPWVHYLEGNAGTPELLVAGDGRILAHLDGKAFGRVTYEGGSATSSAYANGVNASGGYDSVYDGGAATATDLRFYGHIEDPETGLFYNRYRHYDPDTGRYLSPEPLGLMGGLSPFGYAANDPVGMVDPDGLAPVTCVIQGQNDVRASSHTARESPPGIHPVVEAAMAKDIGGKYPNGAKVPIDCAEPAALSAYLYAWRDKDNGNKPLDPNDAAQVTRALGSITSIEASQAGGHKRSPCPNCSQLFANLQKQYGEPTSNKIKPGCVGPKAQGEMTNFMPPVASFQRAEAAQSPNKPNRVTTHKNYPK